MANNDIDFEKIVREKYKHKLLTETQLRGILVGLCEEDLYLFAVRYFRHYLKKPSSRLHRYIYKFLTENLNNEKRKKGFKHAIAAPRSNGKSSLVSCIFILWCICYKKKNFIVMVSDTATQAEAFLGDVKRELLLNEELRKDFPAATSKGELWRTDEIITRNKVKVLALGTGNNIRGRKYGEIRPDLILGDDLESSDMVRSKSQRENIRYDWFNKDVKYVGESGGITDFLIIGTVLGPESLLNALMDPRQYPDWTHKKFKAVYKFSKSSLWDDWAKIYKNTFKDDHEERAYKFFKENKEEMMEGVEILWPEGDPYYGLMVQKLSDPSGFLNEKQNDPIDPRKVLVMRESLTFKSFNTDPEIIKIRKSKRNPFYGAIDPSLGKNDRSDYSAIVTILRDMRTGILLVEDISLQRRGILDQVKDILNMHQRYNYTTFAVEDNSFQITISETLKEKSRETGIYVPVKPITNHYDKFLRIQSIVPFLCDGTIIFDLEKAENDVEYAMGIEQLCTFSKTAIKDDFPDALEMVVRLCKKNRFRMLTRQNRR